VSELSDFGLVVLVVASGVMLALLAAKLSERYPVPAPALFLLAALALPVALRTSGRWSESGSSRSS
jgi:hypothetical protein